MPRKFFRRLSAPYRGNQHNAAWYLRPFRALLAHPVYFSINRRSITGGLVLGLFIGVLPFLGHTPVVVVAALLLRVNLPVAVLSTWIANPLTYGPILYGEYLLGSFPHEIAARGPEPGPALEGTGCRARRNLAAAVAGRRRGGTAAGRNGLSAEQCGLAPHDAAAAAAP